MNRIRLTLALLVVSVCGLGWSTQWQSKPLPLAGLRGSGIGYCVTVEDRDGAVLGMVDVPLHIINPELRKQHGLPPLEMQEFEASVQNATALVVGAEAAKGQTWVCSTTYRDKNGNVIGCQGGCSDCVKVRVKSIQ